MDELLTILNDNPTMTVGENIAEDAENLEVNCFAEHAGILPSCLFAHSSTPKEGGGVTPSLKEDVNFQFPALSLRNGTNVFVS